jgi:hypothetical protein
MKSALIIILALTSPASAITLTCTHQYHTQTLILDGKERTTTSEQRYEMGLDIDLNRKTFDWENSPTAEITKATRVEIVANLQTDPLGDTETWQLNRMTGDLVWFIDGTHRRNPLTSRSDFKCVPAKAKF